MEEKAKKTTPVERLGAFFEEEGRKIVPAFSFSGTICKLRRIFLRKSERKLKIGAFFT
ncbi:MAG: hypothetical protein Q4C48_01405 [Lachnospiraceae bacterium]|nr:hypothetical protein [Lachnospiraceae bacterium]